MFIPIHDNMPDDDNAKVSIRLMLSMLALHVLLFFFFVIHDRIFVVYDLFALKPALLKGIPQGDFRYLHTYVSHMFLHAGLIHLFGNLLILYLCGKTVEARFGSSRFFLFFILCGICGGIAHAQLTYSPDLPIVGASGAISGLIGAYLILVPHARINCYYFIVFWQLRQVDFPAYAVIIVWLIYQVLAGIAGYDNVAWFAHIGGFVAGVVLCPLFKNDEFPLFLPRAETGAKAAWMRSQQRDRAAHAKDFHALNLGWIAQQFEDHPEAGRELAALTDIVTTALPPPYDDPMQLGRFVPEADDALHKASHLLLKTYGEKAGNRAERCADNLRLNYDHDRGHIWKRIQWLTDTLVEQRSENTAEA